MKFFISFTFVFTLFLIICFLSFLGIGGLFISKTNAVEYSPLDFMSDYSKFEVIVGVDKNEGRYFTYHYEFND